MNTLLKNINIDTKFSLSNWIGYLTALSPDEWSSLQEDYSFRSELHKVCKNLINDAYVKKDEDALSEIHKSLAIIYDHDFSSANINMVNCETQPIFRDLAALLEDKMLKYELDKIDENVVSSYPKSGDDYVIWLKKLISNHNSSIHSLYNNYISKHANKEDLKFFLAQETNLDPRFDDILALIQVGVTGGEKMEIASNYYDEMGNGDPDQVHTFLFSKALNALAIDKEYIKDNMILEAQISGNLSACLALSRRHYYKAIGYFGVTEYLAPRRFKHLVSAWHRNKLPKDGIVYHDLHIRIDTIHASGWLNNVVLPLIDKDEAIGREIALGALIRLNSSSIYLDALLDHFDSEASHEVA